METYLLIAAIVVMVVGFAAVLGALLKRKDDAALGMIKQDLQGMSTQITSTTKEINDRLNKAADYMLGVQKGLGEMQEIGRNMRELQEFLRSPKLRGNVGEKVMRDLLEQMIPKGNLSFQHGFKSGVKVDAIIKTRNGIIPIDAKFPMENFNKAAKSKDEAEQKSLLHEFAKDVRKHVLDIGRKYILPGEGTVDFALMYVPSEAIYYEIIANDELLNIGSDQSVYIVSPNTFYYFVKTIMLALEGEKVEERARMVLQALRGIQQDARKFGDELGVLDGHLNRAHKAMDSVASSYTRLGTKIETTSQLQSSTVEKIEETASTIEEPLVTVPDDGDEI